MRFTGAGELHSSFDVSKLTEETAWRPRASALAYTTYLYHTFVAHIFLASNNRHQPQLLYGGTVRRRWEHAENSYDELLAVPRCLSVQNEVAQTLPDWVAGGCS